MEAIVSSAGEKGGVGGGQSGREEELDKRDIKRREGDRRMPQVSVRKDAAVMDCLSQPSWFVTPSSMSAEGSLSKQTCTTTTSSSRRLN